MILRRCLCTQSGRRSQWPVKQVTTSNFSEALDEIEGYILDSDFVAVSMQTTGTHAATWQKLLSIDTPETAYLKAKRAAERFQVLQFAVCPFSIKGSKLIAYPYNFHLFPRDELNVGMPAYSFSCQASYLTSMAREGFDFNACIHNGISYLSRSQESVARHNGSVSSSMKISCFPYSVADNLFKERTKNRVKSWINACKDSSKSTGDALLISLRKIVSGDEVFGSRPSLTIDIYSERQVMLALEALKGFKEVVALQVPAKGTGMQTIHVIFTSSEEDKKLLEKELQAREQEERRRVRGFSEVIKLISKSQKPVVAHNILYDFAFIHSKFISSLSATLDEFKASVGSVFSCILDTCSLMEEVGPFDKMNNTQAATAYLDGRFYSPVEMDIPERWIENISSQGHNVLRLSQFFAKLCSILKIHQEAMQGVSSSSSPLHRHMNRFTVSSKGLVEEDGRDTNSMISVDKLVFLWGFRPGSSVQSLKALICESNTGLCPEDLDVKMVDNTCAVAVFKIGDLPTPRDELKNMNFSGLKSAGYNMYRRACENTLWKRDLADCLEGESINEKAEIFSSNKLQPQQVVHWNNADIINLDEL